MLVVNPNDRPPVSEILEQLEALYARFGSDPVRIRRDGCDRGLADSHDQELAINAGKLEAASESFFSRLTQGSRASAPSVATSASGTGVGAQTAQVAAAVSDAVPAGSSAPGDVADHEDGAGRGNWFLRGLQGFKVRHARRPAWCRRRTG